MKKPRLSSKKKLHDRFGFNLLKVRWTGVFRRETASGFCPWCNVVSPRWGGWRCDCVVGGMETSFQ